MKNTTSKKNLHPYPSNKTSWAYYMQAIEPKSETINNAFPSYHPQWLQMSQMMTIGAENFMLLRLMLGMSLKQCAAYLRVDQKTISRWEHGNCPVPFAEFELLRLILESAKFKTSHPEWDGWFIGGDGNLMSPDYGRAGVTPEQIHMIPMLYADNAIHRSEVLRLQTELDESVAENTRLRQMFLSQGVVDELASIQDRMKVLIACIATARVIPFHAPDSEQHEERAA